MYWLKIKFSNFISFVFLFLLIFDLKIIGSVGSATLVLFCCLLYILSNPKVLISKSKSLISAFDSFLFSYLILIIFVLIRLIAGGGADLSYLLTMIKTTSILLSMFLYLLVFYDDNILERIVNVFFVNGVFCLFFGTFHEFKFLINPFQYGNDVFGLIGDSEYRTAFLAGSGYFGISSLYSIVFVIALYIVSRKPTLFNLLKIFVIAAAGILAGRVALVCYFICLLFFTVRKMSISYLIFGFFAFGLGYYVLNNVDYFYTANAWIMEMFGQGDITQSNSIMDLKTMFFVPETSTLLFGDGRYGGLDAYYGGTDVGYLRHLLFGGIFYALGVVLVSFLLIYKAKNSFIIIIMFLIALFLHFKAVFLLNNPGFFGIFGLVAFYFYNQSKAHNKVLLK